jgi:hypothetical protein
VPVESVAAAAAAVGFERQRAVAERVKVAIDIGAPGLIAMIEDTEGNRVGLHEARLPQPA